MKEVTEKKSISEKENEIDSVNQKDIDGNDKDSVAQNTSEKEVKADKGMDVDNKEIDKKEKDIGGVNQKDIDGNDKDSVARNTSEKEVKADKGTDVDNKEIDKKEKDIDGVNEKDIDGKDKDSVAQNTRSEKAEEGTDVDKKKELDGNKEMNEKEVLVLVKNKITLTVLVKQVRIVRQIRQIRHLLQLLQLHKKNKRQKYSVWNISLFLAPRTKILKKKKNREYNLVIIYFSDDANHACSFFKILCVILYVNVLN